MKFPKFSGKYDSPGFKPKDVAGLPSRTYVRETPVYPSRNAADTAAAAKRESPRYTGTAMIGVATMHKSNLVPVFSREEAIDAATMRRS